MANKLTAPNVCSGSKNINLLSPHLSSVNIMSSLCHSTRVADAVGTENTASEQASPDLSGGPGPGSN